MDTSLIRELAELALAGSGQHCHEEALCIAEWLERLGQDEAARLIRISSLANQGRYQEALAFAHGNPWPALEPWFALCEWHLGLGAALDRRLAGAGRQQRSCPGRLRRRHARPGADMSRIDTPPGFAVYPSASPKAANLPAVDQVLAFEQALGGEPPAAGRRLAGLENGALGERLLQRFAQPLQGLEADRLELKAMLRAELPLGRQQQTFLLQLLGAVEHAPGGEYLAQLARRELQVLIPLNGMLDNLVRNSHKLDLES